MRAVDVDVRLLVPQARAGKPEAWEQLFRRYQLPLYAYVFELVHQEEASLDIVQETFLNALRHIGSLRWDEKFGAWLFGIAHQKCAQHFRQTRRADSLLDAGPASLDEPSDPEDNPSALLIRKEQEQQAMELLNCLPPAQRAVLMLHLLEDFSLEDIAEITAVPLGTVKSRLHHAKKKLRQWLQDST